MMKRLMDTLAGYSADVVTKCSLCTRHTYASHIRAFLRALGPSATPETLTPATFRRAMTEYARSHRPRSVRTWLFALRSFCVYLVKEGYLTQDPTEGIKPPMLDKAHRETPTDAEVSRLLAACDRLRDPYREALARAVVSVLCYTGLRRAELLALKVADVDLRQGEMHIRHGKGDKYRMVAPAPCCLEAVKAFLKLRHAIEGDWLFAQDKKRRLGNVGLRSMLEELQAIAGLKGNRALLPHSIRHNYATRLLRAGADIHAIGTALGHSSMATTAIYLHTDAQRLHQIASMSELPPLPAPAVAEPPARRSAGKSAGKASAPPVRPSRETDPRPAKREPDRRAAADTIPATSSRFQREDLRPRPVRTLRRISR